MVYESKSNELLHYGVRGMRWGIRRYRNPDGTLTNAGKRKLQKERQKNLEKARTAKVEKQKAEADRQRLLKAGKLPASKMTDDELNARIRRLENEKRYKDLTRETAKINKGKEFAKKIAGEAFSKIVVDNAIDIGKQVAKHYGVEFANKKIGKTKLIKNPETEEMMSVIDEVIFTNNKRKS